MSESHEKYQFIPVMYLQGRLKWEITKKFIRPIWCKSDKIEKDRNLNFCIKIILYIEDKYISLLKESSRKEFRNEKSVNNYIDAMYNTIEIFVLNTIDHVEEEKENLNKLLELLKADLEQQKKSLVE